jgi:SAM-dependent methyltransferase
MNRDDYEYRGLLAAAWDFMRADMSFTDSQYYRDIMRSSGEPVLDVGCGTGRLLLEYAADGIDVDGVDNSPQMLAICREKAADLGLVVSLYAQEMEALDLPRRYGTIFVPSMSFQLVPDVADAHRALDGFYRHLLPGGTLVLTVWHIQGEGSAEWGDWWVVLEKEGFEDGRTLKRWERSRYDAGTQLRHTQSRYELLEDGQVAVTEEHERSPELRNYGLAQLSALLEEAGFDAVYGLKEFSDEPATEEDEIFCILGRKAGQEDR